MNSLYTHKKMYLYGTSVNSREKTPDSVHAGSLLCSMISSHLHGHNIIVLAVSWVWSAHLAQMAGLLLILHHRLGWSKVNRRGCVMCLTVANMRVNSLIQTFIFCFSDAIIPSVLLSFLRSSASTE